MPEQLEPQPPGSPIHPYYDVEYFSGKDEPNEKGFAKRALSEKFWHYMCYSDWPVEKRSTTRKLPTLPMSELTAEKIVEVFGTFKNWVLDPDDAPHIVPEFKTLAKDINLHDVFLFAFWETYQFDEYWPPTNFDKESANMTAQRATKEQLLAALEDAMDLAGDRPEDENMVPNLNRRSPLE